MMVNVEVTQEMIYKGEIRNCRNCPIALAVQEVVEEGCYFQVTVADIFFHGHRVCLTAGDSMADRRIITVKLPQVAQDFIHEFDLHEFDLEPKLKQPSPISFQLDIPDRFLRSRQGMRE